MLAQQSDTNLSKSSRIGNSFPSIPVAAIFALVAAVSAPAAAQSDWNASRSNAYNFERLGSLERLGDPAVWRSADRDGQRVAWDENWRDSIGDDDAVRGSQGYWDNAWRDTIDDRRGMTLDADRTGTRTIDQEAGSNSEDNGGWEDEIVDWNTAYERWDDTDRNTGINTTSAYYDRGFRGDPMYRSDTPYDRWNRGSMAFDQRYWPETRAGERGDAWYGRPVYDTDLRDGEGDDSRRRVQVRGELEGWSRMNLRNQPDTRTFVQLRLDRGQRMIVDLGSDVSLSRLDLDRGDRMEVVGHRAFVDGRSVLTARQVRTDEETVEIGPRGGVDRQTGSEMPLDGRLRSWSTVDVQGQRDAHTVVRLELLDGRNAIVNLGPDVTPSDLELNRGDRVRIIGDRGAIGGREVLMARRISTGDGTVMLDDWDRSGAGSGDR